MLQHRLVFLLGLVAVCLTLPAAAQAFTFTPMASSPVGGTGKDGKDLAAEFNGDSGEDAAENGPKGRAIMPSIRFGEVRFEAPDPVTKSTTVFSVGSDPLVIGEVSLEGTDASQFRIVSDECGAQVLSPDESCVVEVRLALTSIGEKEATLRINNNGAAPLLVPVEITVIDPQMEISRTTLEFGRVNMTRGATAAVIVASTGRTELRSVRLGFDGLNQLNYSWVKSRCDGHSSPIYLQPGHKCRLFIRFAPRPGPVGPRPASVLVDTRWPHLVRRVQLRGVAVEAPFEPATAARLELTGPRWAKAGRKVKLRVKATSTGTDPISGAMLAWTARQGKTGKVKLRRQARLGTIRPGKSIVRTPSLRLQRRKYEPGKPVRFNFRLIHKGRTLARANLNVRTTR